MTVVVEARTGAEAGADRVPARNILYTPREPVDLRLTLGPLRRGPYDPTTVFDASGVWHTMTTPSGSATLHLAQRGDGAIAATAWGEGRERALERVPELLGARDDWSGLDVSAHPLLREIRRRMPGLRLTRTGQVFRAMVPAIIEQKVTSVSAYRAWRRLLTAYGCPAPGPTPVRMRIFPDVHIWRSIPSWAWHRAGVDPRRSRAVLAAARVASGLERTMEAGGGPEVTQRLCSVPGVGVWTAAETIQRSHGDPDTVSVGDYSLAAVVGNVLIGKAVDDAGMLELLEPWAGHRQRVVRLIAASGIRPERHGPRATITDHRSR